jgi:vancomycin resistance protein VanJ
MSFALSRFTWGYVFLFSVWMLLRLIFFDRLWWVGIINLVGLYLFVPLLVLLPLVLWCRQWRSLLGLGFPLGVFIAFYSPLFLPSFPVATSQHGRVITAMTFNMLLDNEDYDAIARMVAKTSPDIIGWQEVRSETAPILAQRFASTYPYHAFNSVKQYHNVGILSRFPIEDVTVLPTPPLERGLLATLRLDEQQRLEVIVAHLTPNYPPEKFMTLAKQWFGRRAVEANYLRDMLKHHEYPSLVLCDCNFVPTSEAYARIHDVMLDSFQEVGWGFGHTTKGLRFVSGRIDYIWHTRDLQAVDAAVAHDAGSDHFPVVARLKF